MPNLSDTDHLRNALYEAIVNMPISWLNTAQDLKRSADLLLASAVNSHRTKPQDTRIVRGHMSSYCLLMGFAFENLVKGVHLSSFSQSATPFDDARADWKDGGHGFTDLARRSIDLSDIEINVLRKLQEFVVWSGKYAIPNKPGRFNLDHWLTGDLFPDADQLDAIQPLFSKLEAIVLQTVPTA